MTQSSYPNWLETWWLQQAALHFRKSYSREDLSYLDPLVKDIQELSDLFTTERPEQFTNYTQTAQSSLAYGLFFFPQSFVKTMYVMAELLEFWKWSPKLEGNRPLRILDLGAGLGAVGTAAALMVRQAFPDTTIHLHATDHSPESLNWLKKLWGDNTGQLTNIKLETQTANALHYPKLANNANAKYDLILLGFSLNEILSKLPIEQKLDWLNQLASQLSPNGLLIILEPALQQTAQSLQRLSDLWISTKRGYRWGGYLHQGPCPILTSQKHWNHEVRHWQPPTSIEYLNRTLWRHSAQNLKFSFTALSHQPPLAFGPSPQLIRLVSPMSLMKAEFIFNGVASDGNLHTYHALIRGLKKHDLKIIQEQFERGDILFLESPQPMKTAGEFRLNSPQQIQVKYHPCPALK